MRLVRLVRAPPGQDGLKRQRQELFPLPMYPYLNQHHVILQSEVREFALEAIAPVARELDETARFPWKNVRAMAERGWFGVPVPRELSGMGCDYLSYVLVVEELARHDASHAITVSAHTTLATSPIVNFGSREQRARFVPLLASGQVLGGFGLTEPGAGSDASGTRTRAVRVNDGYSITGSKIFITHGGVGEIFVVTAVTDHDAGHGGITSFVVCKPTVDVAEATRVGVGHRPGLPYTDGVTSGAKEDKLGWRASDTRQLFLQDAWVPESQRLGGEGAGFTNFMKTLDAGRIGVAALSLGIAQGAFDVALDYTTRRRQFNRPIWDFQDVQFGLADLATEIEAARHLAYHAAWLKDTGRPYGKQASMAKLMASELAAKSARRAVQCLGGAGYTSDHPVERMMRDAKGCEIGEGTSEIQKLIIGRHLLKEVAP